jgi:hypothetical protein
MKTRGVIRHFVESNFTIKHLFKYECIFETAQPLHQGSLRYHLSAKNLRKKSRGAVSLSLYCIAAGFMKTSRLVITLREIKKLYKYFPNVCGNIFTIYITK